MTTSAHAEPCWTIVMPGGVEWADGDGIPHYATEKDARDQIASLAENHGAAPLYAEALASPCWDGPDCAGCGQNFSRDWCDGYGHTQGWAPGLYESCDWRTDAAGRWFCGDCEPEEAS